MSKCPMHTRHVKCIVDTMIADGEHFTAQTVIDLMWTKNRLSVREAAGIIRGLPNVRRVDPKNHESHEWLKM